MALQGTIETFPLTDVLTLLGSSAKTGRLSLDGDRGSATLWVDAGSVVGGEFAERPADDTAKLVFEMLRFQDGAFEFTSMDADELPTGDLEPTALVDGIGEAEELFARWEKIEAVVPSLRHRVSLVAELPHEEFTVDPFVWSVIVAAGRTPVVGGLAAELDLDEFAACEAVASLVEEGLAEIGEPEQLPALVSAFDAVAPEDVDAGERVDVYGSPRRLDADEATAEQDLDAARSAALPVELDAPTGATEPPTFPERFPIDDLLGESGIDDEDPWSSPEMEQLEAQRRADAESFEDVRFSSLPPIESVPFGEEPTAEPIAEPLADAERDDFRSTAAAWDEMVVADPRESPSGRTEDDTADEVLRQMSKLSPKAAEAIAAALSTVPAPASADVDEREDDAGTDGPVSFLGSF